MYTPKLKTPATLLCIPPSTITAATTSNLWSPQERHCFHLLKQLPSPSPTLSPLLQIHAYLLRCGLDCNLHLLTLLIASSPSTSYTLRLFSARPSQDSRLCNAALRNLLIHRRFLDSLALYRHLLRHQCPFAPDLFTFPSLLKACATLVDPSEHSHGLQLHTHVIKMGFCFHDFSCTALVDMYAKYGDMVSATKVFDGMPEKTVASWTSLALGYAGTGNTGIALKLFGSMPEKDVPAYNAMIDVLVKMGDLGSARRFFDEMPAKNVVSWTSLLAGYCYIGDLDAARVLFDEMEEKNLYTWNVMIGGYCQNRQPRQALALFRELQSNTCKYQPDEVTILSIVPAIADVGAIELGRWIHNYARRKGMESSSRVSTALLDMYAKCGDVAEAKQVFINMLDRPTASWNAMINGLAVNGRAKEALDVFMDMRKSGQCPNAITMIGVLSACNHGGLVAEGRRWFMEMDAFGIERRIEHYGCMVDLLGRGGYLEEAECLVKDMPFAANGIILSSLLFACGCCGDVARAERVMGMAAMIEPGNVMNYVIMRNLYAGIKRWADVDRIKGTIGRFGGKKEAGCSVIEVGCRLWEFVAGDMGQPEWEVISRVLRHVQLHMKGLKEEDWDLETIISEDLQPLC